MELIAVNISEEMLDRALTRSGVECSLMRLQEAANGTFDMVLAPPVAATPTVAAVGQPVAKPAPDRGERRAASGDPRWSRAVYGPTNCEKCAATIGKGAEAFYVPKGEHKGMYCTWQPDANDLAKLPCAVVMANYYGVARPTRAAA